MKNMLKMRIVCVSIYKEFGCCFSWHSWFILWHQWNLYVSFTTATYFIGLHLISIIRTLLASELWAKVFVGKKSRDLRRESEVRMNEQNKKETFQQVCKMNAHYWDTFALLSTWNSFFINTPKYARDIEWDAFGLCIKAVQIHLKRFSLCRL